MPNYRQIRQLRTRAICALVALPVALAACSQERVQIVHPPATLTQCDDEPVPPSLPARDQQAERDTLTLSYILDLRSAYGSCRAAVDGVRAWSEALD